MEIRGALFLGYLDAYCLLQRGYLRIFVWLFDKYFLFAIFDLDEIKCELAENILINSGLTDECIVPR